MSRAHYGKAPGEKGGATPKRRKLKTPRYLTNQQAELEVLWDLLRYPLASHVYGVICMFSDFQDGGFLGSYAGLIDYCTQPRGERGRPLAGPSYKQMRTAVDLLVRMGLVVRGEQNKEQGQLRLWVRPRDSRRTSSRLEGRV